MPENTVKTQVRRLRQRYRELLRDEVAQTVANPAEIDEEMRHLLPQPWPARPVEIQKERVKPFPCGCV